MPNEPASRLPWDALHHTEGGIPWNALEQFAGALVANPTLWEQLRDAYDDAVEDWHDRETYECYYIPAIFALAAPRLDEAARAAIGRFLVDELVVAAGSEDDGLAEVLEAASGSMGPPVLPAVLDALDRCCRRYHEAWVYLWGLALLAADCTGQALRERVAKRCRQALEQAARGRFDSLDASDPARVLARMGQRDALPLMRQVQQREPCGNLADAIAIMEGQPDPDAGFESWEEPVQEWLEGNWAQLRDRYENPDEDEDGDGEEDFAEAYGEQLVGDFIESPAARALPDTGQDEDDEEHEGDDSAAPDRLKPETLHVAPSVGRNDPCPCGSGKKFKKCCAQKGADG